LDGQVLLTYPEKKGGKGGQKGEGLCRSCGYRNGSGFTQCVNSISEKKKRGGGKKRKRGRDRTCGNPRPLASQWSRTGFLYLYHEREKKEKRKREEKRTEDNISNDRGALGGVFYGKKKKKKRKKGGGEKGRED